jgi:hypothetical protein
MSRTTTILVLLQTLLVVIGFLALGVVLKIAGYPEDFTVRWGSLAVFLRERGAWLLLVPVVWVCFATGAQRLDRGMFSYRAAVIGGVCVAGVLIVLFLYAVIHPYSRPLLLHVR